MYRTICTQLWTDPKVRTLSMPGKLLFLYCITNPHTHLSGVYYLPVELIRKEAGLSDTLSHTLFDTLSEIGLCHRDADTETIFVTNMFRYQGRGEKNERAAARHLATLHHSSIIQQFLVCYPSVKQYWTGYPIDTLSDSGKSCPPVPVLLTRPNLHPNPNLQSNGGAEEFEQFWLAYPKKVGKKEARKTWTKAKDRPAIADILAKVALAKQTAQWTKDHGQFIPNPSTWLNQGRWDDEPAKTHATVFEEFLARGGQDGPKRLS